MTHPLSHLAPADRHQAEFDDGARIAIIQRDRWIDYPRAAQARERLNRLLATPQRERMPCMVLYGESNIGKTLIIRRFTRDHPNAFDAAAGVERIPVAESQADRLGELLLPGSCQSGVSRIGRTRSTTATSVVVQEA